ncbi:MAG: PP0621 family protein [Desulfurella sp.]|uniref:PP0621 family protein n=1 Tax=Desulfurella sp. TaxID=1962857 RepID=UPI003D11F5D0
MLKLFLLILFVIYIYYVIRKKRKIKQNTAGSQLDELVKCENCGIYFSKKKAIRYKNLFFCSKKCKKQYEDKVGR